MAKFVLSLVLMCVGALCFSEFISAYPMFHMDDMVSDKGGVNHAMPSFRLCGSKESDQGFPVSQPYIARKHVHFNVTVDYTWEHELNSGTVETYMYLDDSLMFHVDQMDFCASLKMHKDKVRVAQCPFQKGEEIHEHATFAVNDYMWAKGHYHGNMTVRNEENEIAFCVEMDYDATK
ncbi:uncharacterized protein LOC144446688 [Glandiceps talaboti]